MNSEFLSSLKVKETAHQLGFIACGMAPALPLPHPITASYLKWIARSQHADMHYLARNLSLRFNPDALVPGVHTVISVALSYYPTQPVKGISLYAQGKDYHKVMRKRLKALMNEINATGRCFVDTAPVMEKFWAWRCGLGWIGKHTQFIIPGAGITHFLGELFVHQRADSYDMPRASRCGNCQTCRNACPTHSLTTQGLNANTCLSYLTIENRGPLPTNTPLDDTFYGCDICLKACPHFRYASTGISEFQPSIALQKMQLEDWKVLREEEYQTLFAESAVRRAGYEGLRRNIEHYFK